MSSMLQMKPMVPNTRMGDAVAERKHLLRLHLLVGKNAHEGGHEDGDDALHGKEPFDLGTQADVAEITAERRKICAPDGEFQE